MTSPDPPLRPHSSPGFPGFDATRFGAALRTRRREIGLTQQDVAGVIDVSRRVVGELEGGRGTVRLEIALEAARALGLNVALVPRGGAWSDG